MKYNKLILYCFIILWIHFCLCSEEAKVLNYKAGYLVPWCSRKHTVKKVQTVMRIGSDKKQKALLLSQLSINPPTPEDIFAMNDLTSYKKLPNSRLALPLLEMPMYRSMDEWQFDKKPAMKKVERKSAEPMILSVPSAIRTPNTILDSLFVQSLFV